VQIFIGRVYMGKDMDKQDKNTMLISDDCLYIEYIGRIFWDHIKWLWGSDVAWGAAIWAALTRAILNSAI